MLVDILREVPLEQITDCAILYRFPLDLGVATGEYVIDSNLTSQKRYILFFCCSGAINLRRKHFADIEIGEEEIILLSDLTDLISVVVHESPAAYCWVINPATCSIFDRMYRMLVNASRSYEDMQSFLQKYGGYLKIKHNIWNQSLFSILNRLPDSDRGFYCILKAFELFYLFHAGKSVCDDIPKQSSMPYYLTKQLICIGKYIENHLDENSRFLCFVNNLTSPLPH